MSDMLGPLFTARRAKDILALTRQEGESIILRLEEGKTIKVYLDYADFGQAKLAFEAQREVLILREELDE